jgi:hypothetical protein
MYVDESDARLNSYDMIISRDLLHELGIDLLFSLGVMKWDNATVPMRDPSQLRDSIACTGPVHWGFVVLELATSLTYNTCDYIGLIK